MVSYQVTIRPSVRTHALSVFRGRQTRLKAGLLVAGSAVDIEGVVHLGVASISMVIPDIRVSLRVNGSTGEQRRYDENAPHCLILHDGHWLLPTEDRFRNGDYKWDMCQNSSKAPAARSEHVQIRYTVPCVTTRRANQTPAGRLPCQAPSAKLFFFTE